VHRRLAPHRVEARDVAADPARVLGGGHHPRPHVHEGIELLARELRVVGVHQLRVVLLGGERHLLFDQALTRHQGHVLAVVLQAHRAHQHQPVHALRVGAGEAGAGHAAHGVGDDVHLADLQVVQQAGGVGGHHVEVDRQVVRLGRLAEVDLVRRHDAVALGGQRRDHRRPVAAREVAAVEQDHGAAVGGGGGRDVHVRHAQGAAFPGDWQVVHGVGVGVALEGDAVGLGAGGLRRGQGRRQQGDAKGGGREDLSHGGLLCSWARGS